MNTLRVIPILVVLAVGYTAGCARTIVQDEPSIRATLPAVEQVDLPVELRLSPELREATCQFDVSVGCTAIRPMGRTLCENAEMTARQAFSDVRLVATQRGQTPTTSPAVRAILVPRVAALKRDRPATVLQDQTMTMSLSWTLLSPDGDVIYATTIQSQGKGPWNAIDPGHGQVRRLVQDAFSQSLTRLTSAPVVLEYARRHGEAASAKQP